MTNAFHDQQDHTVTLRPPWRDVHGSTRATPFNLETFLARTGNRSTALTAPKKQILFSQGDNARAVFYIQAGLVTLTVVSAQGKEGVVAMLEPGAFCGESCLAGQTVHTATATARENSCLVRIDKDVMLRLLHEEPTFAELFQTYLLSRSMRIQEDLVDQLFNPSEKRLARTLLLMAHFDKESRTQTVVPMPNQETLAEMIGTTRSRVSFFLNKFRKLGFIDYNGQLRGNQGMHVRRSLLYFARPDGDPI